MKRKHFITCAGCAGLLAASGCAPQSKGDPIDPTAVSYCGVDCADCDIRRYTLTGDKAALERAMAGWTKTAQEHWGMESIDPCILRCEGCRTEGAPKDIFKGCRHCPIRRCARERDLATCGHCEEWRECPKLANILREYPDAKRSIEAITKAAKT